MVARKLVIELKDLFRLTNAQIEPASRIIARAFQDDPLMEYYFPDESVRKEKLPYTFEFLLNYVITRGEVYAISPKLEGIALWLSSDKAHITLEDALNCGGLTYMSKVGSKVMQKQMDTSEYMHSIHENLVPSFHWYLNVLGVDPEFQGMGNAGILLRSMFAQIYAKNLSCYLETHNEKNIPVYQHFGFEILKEFKLPKTNVITWSMYRDKST